MNYDTESWYKLYIRESTEDRLLPVLNRALRDFLLRCAKSRKDGTVLAHTESPGEDIARALGAHPDEASTVAGYVASMLRDGYLSHRRGRLWITNFVAAQEARSPGARRQKRYRDKDKSSRTNDTRETDENVTPDITDNVTRDAHVTSQEIRSDPRRSDPRRSEEIRSDAHARPGWLERARVSPRKPDEEPQPRIDELAERLPFTAWAPSQQMLDWAKEKRLPDAKFDAALIELRDKCQGLHDVAWWDLKAISFLRNAIAWYQNPKAGNGHAGPAESGSDDQAFLLRARRGEYGRDVKEQASGPQPIVADLRRLVRDRAANTAVKPPKRESA